MINTPTLSGKPGQLQGFDPDAAVAALDSLEAASGLHALSAKYTLRSFRSGTLDLDW